MEQFSKCERGNRLLATLVCIQTAISDSIVLYRSGGPAIRPQECGQALVRCPQCGYICFLRLPHFKFLKTPQGFISDM